MSNLEGILLTKTPFKDKNLIGHVLLRNGFKVSVLFYGGLGGGKKHKGSILQLGYLLSFHFSGSRTENFEMLNSSEYKEKWYHDSISNNPKGFYLLCFYNEFLDKFSPLAHSKFDLEEDESSHVGLFRLLSNAIFRLDKVTKTKRYDHYTELGIFLSKALVELGIFPDTGYCVVSGTKIGEDKKVFLSADKGGFAFAEFAEAEELRKSAASFLNQKIKEVSESKYLDITELIFTATDCSDLFNFICYQQHVRQTDFKTFSMNFS